jgi:hypothetical protein
MRRLAYLLRRFEEGAAVECLNRGQVSTERQEVIDDMCVGVSVVLSVVAPGHGSGSSRLGVSCQ